LINITDARCGDLYCSLRGRAKPHHPSSNEKGPPIPADRGWAFKCPVATASSEYFNANVDVEPLKTVIIFSGIGLLLPLLAIQTYGLDLSVGFF